MPNTFYKHSNRPAGFTIVELLIVVIVIAILAAITIVAFNGIQTRAEESKLQADLRNAAVIVKKDAVLDGAYPLSDVTVNEGRGFNPSAGTRLEYTSDGTSFCISATSTVRVVRAFFYDSETGLTVAGAVCPGHAEPSIGGGAGTWSEVAAGGWHTCAGNNGTISCWGRNLDGQLGRGSTSSSSLPVLVEGTLSTGGVSSMSLGAEFSCAIKNGELYCWGANTYGQLGNNTLNNILAPAEPIGGLLEGKTVTQVSAGYWHVCAIADGQAYCWGQGSSGSLGNGANPSNQQTPVAVGGVLAGKTISSIAAGGSHTCAISEGKVFCWGSNVYGSVGSGSVGGQRNTPIAVVGDVVGKTATNITTGWRHSCAIANNQVHCWGENGAGQLGNGLTTDTATSTVVSGLLSGKNATSITAGMVNIGYSCAVADEQVYCWGENNYNQLGAGLVGNQTEPVLTQGVLAGQTVTTLIAGGSHTCATSASKLYCWGRASNGQVGNGSTATSVELPTEIFLPS